MNDLSVIGLLGHCAWLATKRVAYALALFVIGCLFAPILGAALPFVMAGFGLMDGMED